jgi:hypothetical protein
MSRRTARPLAQQQQHLWPEATTCACCGHALWIVSARRRTVVRLDGVWQVISHVRACPVAACPGHRARYVPEEAGAWALPQSEFGLDVIALVGALRYQQQRSVPQIHHELVTRGVAICERAVTHLVHRYEELVAVHFADPARLHTVLAAHQGVVVAIDGLQPDVGHEVLWVLRDVVSGTVLLARSLLGATEDDLVPLLTAVQEHLTALEVPILGVVSDGQVSIRNAVHTALPDVPHQLCQFHYLREAAKPFFAADRHAKKELKKAVRGVRPIERHLETQPDAQAQVLRAYCLAVRSALTDDGQPPLEAAGLRLRDRLRAVADSLGRLQAHGAKGG